MKRMLAPLIVAVIVLVAMARSVFFIVDETQCAIVTTFGKPVRTVDAAGLNLKWPTPVQSVHYFDKRLQLFDPRPSEAFTLDRKNLVIDAYLLWEIEEPLRFLSKVGSFAGAENSLAAMLTSEVNAELGRHELSDLINAENDAVKLDEITQAVTERCATAAQRDYGIRVFRAGMKRINLPPENRESVYQRMRAEREQKAREYRAEGQEQATIIHANTDLEKRRILADAYQAAQAAKGEGDAEALRIYAEAYAQAPEFYRFMRILTSYRNILKNDTTLFMSSDSELLRLLTSFDESNVKIKSSAMPKNDLAPTAAVLSPAPVSESTPESTRMPELTRKPESELGAELEFEAEFETGPELDPGAMPMETEQVHE